jgi:hypothetical protein
MATFTLAGHALEFADCHEVGQGGPETCSLSIDGAPVIRTLLWWSPRSLRFHPTPLEFEGDILVPQWEATRFYLVRIDPTTLKLSRISRGFHFMRLLRIQDDEIEFSTWHDDRQVHRVRLMSRL